jgi:hypothetical protein
MQYYNQVLDAYLFESRIFSVCTLVVIAVVVVTHGVSYGRRPIVSISSPAALLGCCTSTNEAAVCCIRFATSKRKARTYIIMVRVVWKGFVILRPFSKLSSNASSDCEGLSTDDDLNRWCSVNILRFCSGFCAVLESLEAFRALGSRALKSEGSELFLTAKNCMVGTVITTPKTVVLLSCCSTYLPNRSYSHRIRNQGYQYYNAS